MTNLTLKGRPVYFLVNYSDLPYPKKKKLLSQQSKQIKGINFSLKYVNSKRTKINLILE